ncbi:MAG: 50S ribosomal subunit protein L10 [Candidatus Westeberhardia cardiocondylae]|nr:50S ribosomal subunit protein L10 [Candidatus Westeberhardia cardiocondylae]
MSLNIEKKKLIVSEIKDIVNRSISIVIADFSGVTANGINRLRKISRDCSGIYIKVISNSLFCRIIKDTHFDCLQSVISGPILVGFSLYDPGKISRLFLEYCNSDKNFKIVAASFEKKIILSSNIDLLANLPTRKEGILYMLFVMREIALGKIVRILYLLCDKNFS